MKKLVRTGAMLFGACLVWAAGAKADGVHAIAANIGDEAHSFVAGGENTEARGNLGATLSLVSSGSEDRKTSENLGTHGYTLGAMFHHSEGVGDDDNAGGGSGWQGSSGSESSGGHGSSGGGGGPAVVSTPEPSSLLLLASGAAITIWAAIRHRRAR